MANVDHELNLKAAKFDLKSRQRRILQAVAELRDLCDRVENDVNHGRRVNRSNTTCSTELFYSIGSYEQLLEVIEMLEGKK